MNCKLKYTDEISLIKAIYEFVRDDIKNSWDVQDKCVTKFATEVLEQGVGICWAKANLLAALLRACGIPAGICYQRLTLGDVPETGFCIHALNAVYIKSLNRWIRLDLFFVQPTNCRMIWICQWWKRSLMHIISVH